jgi:hypothetical protein
MTLEEGLKTGGGPRGERRSAVDLSWDLRGELDAVEKL